MGDKPIWIFFKDGECDQDRFRHAASCHPPPTGTVVSIHPDKGLKFTEPTGRRLTQRGMGLRSTADASLFVYGLLDLCACG